MFNVYLICSEINGNRLYKIGYTKRDIEKRIKEFKTGNASSFYLIDSFQSKWGTKIEARLHKLFKHKKVSGSILIIMISVILKKYVTHCTIILN